jgi:uncharacterized membrane protein
MRGTALVGIVLIVLGIAGLIFENFSYTETKPVLKAGPVEVNAKEEHHISIPTVAGVVVLLAGVALVFVGRRSA